MRVQAIAEPPKRYSLKSQIAELERELRWRPGVYQGRVATRAMRQEEADMQIGMMLSALETLQWLDRNHDAIKAASENNRQLWAALQLIHDAVEQHAPPGSLPSGDQLGPEPAREAATLVRAIEAIATKPAGSS